MDYRRHESLEEKADIILSGDGPHKPTSDWFTDGQLRLRASREIPVGLIRGGTRPGLYGRTYNPDIGRRPDPANLIAPGMDPWRQLLWEYYR